MSEVKVEQVGFYGPDADGDYIVTALGDGAHFAVPDQEKAALCVARIEATRALSAEVEALREFYQAVHDMTCVWADTDRPSSICPHRRDEAEDDDEEDLWDNFVATRARVKALLNKEPAR